MGLFAERCAGLDVHQRTVVACLRVPGEDGGRREETRTFSTTHSGLRELGKWLLANRVTLAGMEATGVYWKPVFYALEDVIETWLLNAAFIKNMPGRKTDVSDAAWIAQLLEVGHARPSFVPPPEVRMLRDLTRRRKSLIEDRTREVQRLHKLLEDTGIKLGAVVSDLMGVSSRRILRALIDGERDPEKLADLAVGRLRNKLPELREALVGRFLEHHSWQARQIMEHIERLNGWIEELSERISVQLALHREDVTLLDTIPGVNEKSAEDLLGEFGFDMSRFGSAKHLASWGGICPGNNESAGKHRPTRARKGSKMLRSTLVQAAKAASRTQGTYLAAQYAQLKGRRGHQKATMAVAHSILVIAYHLLTKRVPYDDNAHPRPDTRDREMRIRRHVRDLEALGVTVEVTPVAA